MNILRKIGDLIFYHPIIVGAFIFCYLFLFMPFLLSLEVDQENKLKEERSKSINKEEE